MPEAASSNGDDAPKLPPAKPAGAFEGETMTRRAVFSIGGQALGGAGIGIVGLSALGFAAGTPLFEQADEIWTAVGPPGKFAVDTYRSTVITLTHGVGEAGKTTAYVRMGSPDLEETQAFIAVSTRCAHLGCPVRFVEAANNFICPCHGGVYGFRGEVIGGPPVRPLDRFQTRVRDGQVEVGPRYSVTGDFDPVRYRDPGEFTGGIWNVLFPPRPSTPPAP